MRADWNLWRRVLKQAAPAQEAAEIARLADFSCIVPAKMGVQHDFERSFPL